MVFFWAFFDFYNCCIFFHRFCSQLLRDFRFFIINLGAIAFFCLCITHCFIVLMINWVVHGSVFAVVFGFFMVFTLSLEYNSVVTGGINSGLN